MSEAEQSASSRDYSRLEEAAASQTETREARVRALAAAALASIPQIQPSAAAPQRSVQLISYAGPLIIAGFKDLLDLVLVGSLPGVGTVLTFCLYLLIFMLFVLSEHATARPKLAFLIQAGGMLFFGTAVEGLAVGLNFLPIGLGLILGIYLREKRWSLSMSGVTQSK